MGVFEVVNVPTAFGFRGACNEVVILLSNVATGGCLRLLDDDRLVVVRQLEGDVPELLAQLQNLESLNALVVDTNSARLRISRKTKTHGHPR